MNPFRIASLAALALTAAALGAGPKPKIKPSVDYAPSWDAAVAEGKLLNLPLIVHSHGFF